MPQLDVMQLDDNLRNGQTYTFSLKLENWITSPSDATIYQDVIDYAPDFITSLQVTHQERFLGGDVYNVQFTYEGDGSDVVSDLGAQLVAACSVGSNDNFTFVQAIGAPANMVQGQVGQVISSAGGVLVQAGSEVGAAAGQITSGTLSGATSGLGAWFIPVVLALIVLLMFQLGGIKGLKRSLA
jgi:hypothetical protein